MSGFGQIPQASLGFSLPSMNQPTTTTDPGFSFGTPKTTAVSTPATAPATFGANPSLNMKPNIGLTATPTVAPIPSLGVPQSTAPGTLFGTSWPGLFSGGQPGGPETTSTPSAMPSLASTTAPTAKSSPFTFGNLVTSATTQIQGLPSTLTVTSVAPVSTLAPAVTQVSVASSVPSLSFSFGSTPTQTLVPNTTATATPAAAPVSLNLPTFGVPATKPVATTTPATSITSTPAAGALKFTVSASATLTSTPKTSAVSAVFGATTFSTPSTSATPTASITAPAVSAAAATTASVPTSTANASGITTTASDEDVMTYSKLQENINKWAMELEKQEKIFLHQATEMNGWDRVIVENSDKLHMLNTKIEKVRKEQRHLDLELDFVLSQQNELDYMLKGLEKEWGSVPPSDPERQHTYKIAESLDYKLKLMSEDLKEVVDHMNAMNYPPNDEFNPVMQIVRILNAHMNVLLMVERKTNHAENKVKEVGKLLELCKRDYDRACHLYFD